MAKNLGARKDASYIVLYKVFSVEKIANGTPTPFPVIFHLGQAQDTSDNVFYNGDEAYIKDSDTKSVMGDELGVLLGIVVFATKEMATTFPGSYAPSVFVNGRNAHRMGDEQWMDALKVSKVAQGNTYGTLVKKSAPFAPKITIDGKIEQPNRDNIDVWEALGNTMIGIGVGIMGGMSAIAASVASAVMGGDVSNIPASINPATPDSVPSGGLGSRSGSPVVLQTAQSFHTFSFYPLEGLLPLHLELFYINRASRKGMFGFDRTCSYEKAFKQIDEKHYKLLHPDGRWFAFSYKASLEKYIDHGNLGVSVSKKKEHVFVLTYRDGTVETYMYGLLTKIEDIRYPNNAIEIGYLKHPRAGARIAEVKNTQGSMLTFSYDDFGLVKDIEDHIANVWSFSYDKEGYLLSLAYNDKAIEQYDYMDIKATIEDEHYLRTVYNAHKEPIRTFFYADHGSLSGYTEKEASYSYHWDNEGTISKIDKEGKRHLFTLDAYGSIDSILYPDGSSTSCSYDKETRSYKERTLGNNIRLRTLDEQHRVLSESFNKEEVSQYAYEGDNPYPIRHSKKGKTRTYSYDKNRHLSTVVHPDKTSQSFVYSDEGLLLSQKDTRGKETSYSYDDKDRRIKQTNALGLVTVYTHDKYGRLSSLKDPREEVQHFSYDSHHQLKTYTNAMGDEIHFEHTLTGQVKSITDPAGRKTGFVYDVHDRLIAKLYPFGEKESYFYHSDDSLDYLQRIDGSTLHFSYDMHKNITSVTARQEASSQTTAQTQSLHYSYDVLGNLTEALTATHTVLQNRDSHANITREVQGAYSLRCDYTRDNQIKLLQFLDQQQYFSYNEAGLLQELKTESNPLTKGICLSYNKAQALIDRHYPNQNHTLYSYDDIGGLVSLKETREEKQESKTVTQLDYKRDKLGRVSSIKDKDKADPIDFTYDERQALIEVSIANDANPGTYTYNDAGNLTKHTCEGKTHHYTYNTHNQLIEDDRYIYNYDPRDNLRVKVSKEDGTTTLFSFNLFNQLEHVKVYKSTRQQYLLEQYDYSYDALNRRIEKRYTNPNDTTQNYQHFYLYHNEDIVAILNQDQDLLATLLHHPTQVDTPLSICNELTGETYTYHSNHQGSITHLSNEEGNIVESFTYDAYGKILEHTQEEQTYNPYCYTAREFDSKELYYYRARYYDPSIGRFISSDPIEFMAGDFNFYRYVGNDPVNWVDPSGLNSEYSYAEMGYDATRHVAEGINTLTFGFTGWAGKNLNTLIYGRERAEQAYSAINKKSEFEKRIEQLKQDIKNKVTNEASSNGNDGIAILGDADSNVDICPKCEEECKKAPPIAPTPGNCDYYKKRQESFLKRFSKCKGCGDYSPPDYYMDYGYKYCTQFMEDTYSKMTTKGQEWLKNTLVRLQENIEEKLKTTNECDNMAMRKMAFETHVPAYDPEKMSKLPLSDLSKIGITPDHEEWWGKGSGMTWQQAWDVAKNIDYGEVSGATWDDWGW